MKAFLIVFVVFITFPLFSIRGQEMIDVIYKNNGDILKGLIIETVPNDYVRIELKDGSVFTVKYSEIAKITKEKTATTTEVENKIESGTGIIVTFLCGAFIYIDPYFGTGFRIGGTPIKGLYVGGTAVTNFVKDNSVSYFGGELGYNLSISKLTLQFYASLGTITGGTSTFYVGPGIAIYYFINQSFSMGVDTKGIFLTEIDDNAGGVYLGFQFTW